MRIQLLASGLVCAALTHGQTFKDKWANNCFTNSSSVVCKDHEFAVKPPGKGGASKKSNGFTSSTGTWTPARIAESDIDWRFSDPQADALAGFNVKGLSASPLARTLIAQLAAKQNLTDTDVRKIFDGLAGVDQIALSMRDNRVVVMVTGRVRELTLPPADAELKAEVLSSTAMLFGHADAVDQAAQRIAAKAPPSDWTEFAQERQAVGSGGVVGPEAVSAGMQRLSLAMSIQDRLASDIALEFDGSPSTMALQPWHAMIGAATVEGNVAHTNVSLDPDAARQQFSQMIATPLGERLSALVGAARSLPVRDLNVLKQTRPVIYGLADGPRVVNP
jgi:hypothetical protein